MPTPSQHWAERHTARRDLGGWTAGAGVPHGLPGLAALCPSPAPAHSHPGCPHPAPLGPHSRSPATLLRPARFPPHLHSLSLEYRGESRRTEMPATLLTKFLNQPDCWAKNNRRSARCGQAGRPRCHHAGELRGHGRQGGEASRHQGEPSTRRYPTAVPSWTRDPGGPPCGAPPRTSPLSLQCPAAATRGPDPPRAGGRSSPLPTAVPRRRLTAGLLVAMGIGK